MLLGGILIGLAAGLLFGGRLDNLGRINLRYPALIFLAVIVRFAAEVAVNVGLGSGTPVPAIVFGLAFVVLGVALFPDRRYPGVALALVGVVLNGATIVANDGHMPIWTGALDFISVDPATLAPFYVPVTDPLSADFLLHLGPLSDLIPVPIPLVPTVISIGDVFLSLGFAFFTFAVLTRDEALEAIRSATPIPGLSGSARLPRSLQTLINRGQVRSGTGLGAGLGAGLADAAALEHPLVLSSASPGLANPALRPLSLDAAAVAAGDAATVRVGPTLLERARGHPYIRLAQNASFSSLWAGQLVSLFGDRVHQVALAFLVLTATDSAIAVGLVFMMATVPNLLFGPVAGTLVDRWDQKEVMVVSDLLRAACVLLIPIAAAINLVLIYPLVFLVTTISIFFRPARTAVIPRIVEEDELVTANSATWLGETMADVIGYPIAGVFVGLLGASLPLAFWLDAATYVASALLIAAVAIPAVVRTDEIQTGISGVVHDLRVGWHFLRREQVLLANTLQGVAGQFTAGVVLAVTPIYALEVLASDASQGSAIYGLLETAIGIGNLVGGFAIGLLGARLAKGRLIIIGYTVAGVCVMALGMTGNLELALGLLLGVGVANMVYLIPSQTMFQERTPPDMIGRVVGFRFALVFGALTLAMGVGGIATELIGVGNVLILGGLLTFTAGFAGWFVPAVRDA